MKISEFMNKELPPEILEQLNVVNRVKFLLKPTTSSAISEAEGSAPGTNDELQAVRDDVSKMIDDVAALEDLVNQLEDAADQLLADMEIPPTTDTIADACKQLGGDKITKEMFDKALTIIDWVPMLTMGQDPFLAALTGDGSISGDRLPCSNLGPNIGKKVKLAKHNPKKAEDIIEDGGKEIKINWNKMLIDMAKHVLNVLLWKNLWATLVDQLYINPTRIAIAYPLDSIPGFFQRTPTGKTPDIKRWKIKSKEWLNKFGKANRLLNQVRYFLLCKLVRIIAPGYEPELEGLDCSKSPKCSEQNPIDNSSFDDKIKFHEAADKINDETDPCININDFPGSKPKIPTNFGASPECIQAARVIVETVISDALTPPITRSY